MNDIKKERRPIIGLPGWKTGDNSFGCGTNHLDFISRFGDVRILFPHDKQVKLDLLYLPGGPDVNPTCYGQAPGFYTSNPDVFRQYFFDNNLKWYVESGTPIFGVCLGMQMLNVFFGGTLTQDLKYHAQSNGRWQKGHEVFIVDQPRKQSKFEVNSHHHQAVLYSDLSDQLEMIVYADNEEDGNNCIVEGLKHRELPIIGVQWHPKIFGTC